MFSTYATVSKWSPVSSAIIIITVTIIYTVALCTFVYTVHVNTLYSYGQYREEVLILTDLLCSLAYLH